MLLAVLCLIAYGALVIWTASSSIAAASFSRHLLGIGLGAMLGIACWKLDYQDLANMSTFLLVLDIIVIFSPYIPGLSYNAKGMTGWVKLPWHSPDVPARRVREDHHDLLYRRLGRAVQRQDRQRP